MLERIGVQSINENEEYEPSFVDSSPMKTMDDGHMSASALDIVMADDTSMVSSAIQHLG